MRSYGAVAVAAALVMSTAGAFARNGPVPDEATIGYGIYEYLEWAGIYGGVEGGWSRGKDEAFEIFTSSGFVNDGPLPYDTDGYSVGGMMGINMQVSHWVYGVELDIEHTNLSGRWDWGNGNGLTKKIDTMGSLRARAGFALDRFFLYGTGGLAVGHVTMTAFEDTPPIRKIQGDQMEFGWTAGGGLEVLLFGNWSAGVEYRYTDLGQTEHSGVIYNENDIEFTYTHTNRFHAVRGRLVYRWHI